MFRQAAAKFGQNERVRWLEADACDLPFADRKFDAVVCQFGITFVTRQGPCCARSLSMFLKRDGLLERWATMNTGNQWEALDMTIAGYFEKDPPTFYQIPFSYHNRAEIRRILKRAGFREIKTEVIAKIGKANRAEDVARGLVEGNPVAVTIAKRDPSLLPTITGALTAAITRRFGKRDIRAPHARDCGPGPRSKRSQARCRIEMPITAVLALWVLILGAKKLVIIAVAAVCRLVSQAIWQQEETCRIDH